MPPRLFLALIFVLSISTFAETPPAKDRCVVLISIDGFPMWKFRESVLPIPNIRRLAKEGAQAGAMTIVNPTITWPNHTTLVTGVEPSKHGVLFNGLLVRGGAGVAPKVEPWRNKDELVRVPTIYDAAFNAGLTTAQVDWVAILNSHTISAEMLEVPKRGEIEAEMIRDGALTADDVENFTKKDKTLAWRDTIWTQAAIHILKTRKPNLLMLHLLNTDYANHFNGPDSFASATAYAYADRLVGDVLAAIDESGMREKTTVILTTDHGFKKVTKLAFPNTALRQAGLIVAEKKTQPDREEITRADAYVFTQGGMAFAYVTDPAKKAELLPKMLAVFEKMEGVDKVFDASEGPSLGIPTPEENQGAGDLILIAKPGYAFQAPATREQVAVTSTDYFGTHGYLASDPDLDGVFIAWGCGIKAGTTLPRISNLDVAPTLAELLGVKLPTADGRVLREFLQSDARVGKKSGAK
jgi:predicted AlkP superfamily pyrophosphatase or phosphodiesterase